MCRDYEVLLEKCKTGELLGKVCPKCGSLMVICETPPREMVRKKIANGRPCSSWLIERPPPMFIAEIKEAVILGKIASVATWTRKQVKFGVTKKGKPRWLRAYKITGHPGVFVRDPAGDVVALRFLKGSFGPKCFTKT